MPNDLAFLTDNTRAKLARIVTQGIAIPNKDVNPEEEFVNAGLTLDDISDKLAEAPYVDLLNAIDNKTFSSDLIEKLKLPSAEDPNDSLALNVILQLAILELSTDHAIKDKLFARELQNLIFKIASIPDLNLLWIAFGGSRLSPLGASIFLVENPEFLVALLQLPNIKKDVNEDCIVWNTFQWRNYIKMPPLFMAAICNVNDSVFAALIAAGADVNCRATSINDPERQVPLLAEVFDEQKTLMLLKAKANPNLGFKQENSKKISSPLYALMRILAPSPLGSIQEMLRFGARLDKVEYAGKVLSIVPLDSLISPHELFFPVVLDLVRQKNILHAETTAPLTKLQGSQQQRVMKFTGALPTNVTISDQFDLAKQIEGLIRRVLFIPDSNEMNIIVNNLQQFAIRYELFEFIYIHIKNRCVFDKSMRDYPFDVLKEQCHIAFNKYLNEQGLFVETLKPIQIFGVAKTLASNLDKAIEQIQQSQPPLTSHSKEAENLKPLMRIHVEEGPNLPLNLHDFNKKFMQVIRQLPLTEEAKRIAKPPPPPPAHKIRGKPNA